MAKASFCIVCVILMAVPLYCHNVVISTTQLVLM